MVSTHRSIMTALRTSRCAAASCCSFYNSVPHCVTELRRRAQKHPKCISGIFRRIICLEMRLTNHTKHQTKQDNNQVNLFHLGSFNLSCLFKYLLSYITFLLFQSTKKLKICRNYGTSFSFQRVNILHICKR